MGSRERRRAERQKRKRRAAQRAATPGPGPPAAEAQAQNGASEQAEGFQQRLSRRAEERNEAARAGLEPLDHGERPRAVTVAAAISALLAVVFTVSAALAAAEVEVGGREPEPLPIALFAITLWAMTWGMLRARYWAVLGFQMLLVLIMLASGLGLVQVSTVLQAAATTVLLLGSGLLFYFLIRALARIQMPEPPGRT